jgi:hypothetical protein
MEFCVENLDKIKEQFVKQRIPGWQSSTRKLSQIADDSSQSETDPPHFAKDVFVKTELKH